MRTNQIPANLKKTRFITKTPLSFPHISIVEASAGSGKTRRLAERYVDFLLHYSDKTSVPFNFRNILAITFTNEAADQMKQEILRMLKTTALGKGRDSSTAMQIVDEIIQNFSDFAIRTIDSFVHSLLVASSLELKLPPDYEIKPQPRTYLEYVLDTLLDEVIYDQDIAGLFLGFLNHFLVVEEQKHWSPKRILLSLLIRFYQEENARAKLFKEIPWELDLSRAENDFKDQLKEFLPSLITLPAVNQRFTKGLRLSLDNTGPNFLKSLNRYINRSLLPGEGILNKGALEPDLALSENWKKLKSQYDNYARAFVWSRHSPYLKVFNKFRQRLEDFKEEKRIVFLDELNRKAREFLTSEGFLPAEIYYKLSSVLYHYLIDEFQDTSVLQWENIQALVEDALSKGGSLFYVGDKKQAIYRFRGGEVELFDIIRSRFRSQVAKIYDGVLLYNYRSREIVVEFNNSVFSSDNLIIFLNSLTYLSKEFKEKILAVFKDSQQRQVGADTQGGYVRLELLGGENRQQFQNYLNTKLKDTILQLRERFNYQDILILVRDNQEAQVLASFLLEQGFPVSASRTISIRQNYLVRQIIALLKFLNSPIDNLCFANFILGEVFSVATKLDTQRLQRWLEDLRINKDKAQDTMDDKVAKGQGPEERPAPILYTLFRAAFPEAWREYLQFLFNAVGFLPVYDLVVAILSKFKIEENFAHLSGFTQKLLEIINELEEQGRNSLSDFLEWFDNTEEEDLFVRLPQGLDAIKILTIHKAKGLSSPVVIMPYAALGIKIGEACRVVCERPEGLYLLYLQKEICQNHPDLASIYRKEFFQALLDELNCLYVGFTRAACELYIFLPKKINRSDNPLIPLLFCQDTNLNLKEFGSRIIYPVMPKAQRKESQEQIKPTRTDAFRVMLRDQLIQPGQIISSEKKCLINRGQLLHYLLAEIDPFAFLEDTSLYIQSIREACRLFNYSDSFEIIQRLSEFYRNSKIQQFLNPRFRSFKEKEIVDQCGNLRRIDRLVFADEKILIIDYKTGEEYKREHQQQIDQYAHLIKELYPDRLLEGWLIYVDTKEVRQVNF